MDAGGAAAQAGTIGELIRRLLEDAEKEWIEEVTEIIGQAYPLAKPLARPIAQTAWRWVWRQVRELADMPWEAASEGEMVEIFRRVVQISGAMMSLVQTVQNRFEAERQELGLREPTLGDFWAWLDALPVEDLRRQQEVSPLFDYVTHRSALADRGDNPIGEDDAAPGSGDPRVGPTGADAYQGG